MPSKSFQVDNKPQKLREFIGQIKIKNILKIMIKAAQLKETNIDHIIFSGKPGTGKTTLCKIISNESKRNIHFVQGNLLITRADILSLFSNTKENDIIFIDEIHSINKVVEELIYIAMENFVIDVVIGPDGENKIFRMKLPRFTLLGATTELEKLGAPFFERFGYHAKLVEYSRQNIERICLKYTEKWGLTFSQKSLEMILDASSKIPRKLQKILDRIYDYSLVNEINQISHVTTGKIFNLLQIYRLGLKESHIEYLFCLKDKFYQKWTNLISISSILSESKDLITQKIEPILLSQKLIIKSSQGRKITNEGILYLDSFKY